MKYRVEITPEAEAELTEAYIWIRGYSSVSATTWLRGIREAFDSLSQYPIRCQLAPESEYFRQEIRQLLYGRRGGTYRVLFAINEDVVSILHIRHGARDFLQPDSEEVSE